MRSKQIRLRSQARMCSPIPQELSKSCVRRIRVRTFAPGPSCVVAGGIPPKARPQGGWSNWRYGSMGIATSFTTLLEIREDRPPKVDGTCRDLVDPGERCSKVS